MATKTKAPRFDRPCEHCGDMMYHVLERSTACGACSGLKNDAYRRNVYAGLMRGFEQARDAGLTGAEAREAAEKGIDAFRAARRAEHEAAEQRKRDHAEVLRQRAATNAFLRANGYTWHKCAVGTEDDWAGRGALCAGTGELDHYEWELSAPDGRVVTVAEALREIDAKAVAS